MTLKIARKLYETALETITDDLDDKHSQIVSGAKKLSFSKFLKDFRNWDLQSDSGIPFQVNLYNFKSYGNFRYLKYLISKIIKFIIYRYDEIDYFFDDISIIKLLDGFDILEQCPVHKSPGNNLAFFIKKNVSANVRWLRYIYFTNVVRNYFMYREKPQLIMDIGSFYGGFQYVLKNIFPESSHILVDFPHQLSRAAIFLSKAFPNCRIFSIYDQKTFEIFFRNYNEKYFDFLLLSTDFYTRFSNEFSKKNKKVDLSTNFYSLGEMPKKYFRTYLDSAILKESKNIYFCNRYDSSPFYEKTFHESYSLIDYILEGFNLRVNRSSGIHNYMMPVRKLFGSKKPRPISAGYFEIIQEKEI